MRTDVGAVPRRAGPPRGRARRSTGRSRSSGSCSAPLRSATTIRSGSGFASTDRSIKQRTQNLQLARALLQAAGAENLKFNLTTWNFLDHTDHAASIQAYARQAGIDVGIEVMDVSKYYDSEPAGADYATTTPWLNRPATLTEYGARGVPNIYLTRCYMSTGDWNASHYKKPEFDRLAQHLPGGGRDRGSAERRPSRWRGSSSATRRSSPTTSSAT